MLSNKARGRIKDLTLEATKYKKRYENQKDIEALLRARLFECRNSRKEQAVQFKRARAAARERDVLTLLALFSGE